MDFRFDFELISFWVDFELGLGWVFQWGLIDFKLFCVDFELFLV